MKKTEISIIGLGLIGGSIAKSLKSKNAPYVIKGFDKKNVLKKVLKDGFIDQALSEAEDAAGSDFIFLCLPTELSLSTFGKLAQNMNRGAVITDVCGVKGIFEEKWSLLKSKGDYIGGHPMTGKEAGGYENSDPLLFENAVYVVSEKAKNVKNIQGYLKIIEFLGARPRFLDPFLHDKVIASVSHMPQLLAVALVNASSEQKDNVNYLDFAAGGFRDMTRIASSDFEMWKSIFKLNREEIITAIEKIHKNLNNIEGYLECDDIDRLEEMFNNAGRRRDEIPKNMKGFIYPLADVFVYVKDEPGVLSKLTTLLYNNDVNIKDMELLKIREGRGGTFRLSFENRRIADKAKKLIEESGFATK